MKRGSKKKTYKRNILISIDNIIQYNLDNPGKSGEFGMISRFLEQ